MANRRRPPRPERKPPAPETLARAIAAAKARNLKRRHGPPIFLIRDADGGTRWDWPFADGSSKDQDWKHLLVDAFGTRQEAVAGAFVEQLIELCSSVYVEEHNEWVPDEAQVIMLLHIVGAHKPRNEAEAALAAQIAMTHMILMKVGKRVADFDWDTKMIGAYTGLARASADLFDAMSNAKGRRRTSSQKITVKQEKHIHTHQHQHLHTEGGASNNDRQPQTPMGSRTEKNADGIAALPGPEKAGRVMPLNGRQGQAGLPSPRRSEG